MTRVIRVVVVLARGVDVRVMANDCSVGKISPGSSLHVKKGQGKEAGKRGETHQFDFLSVRVTPI